VQRPFTLVGVNPALDAFTDVANELKENAEKSARAYGQELAATRKPHAA
jgi:FMN-dependent NADH-azoreductase